ncbi:MAG: methyltransferase domain-containing protein [Candidatus Eisenbacteria bacterium]|nr:methyltransferase domain-containing protein [Candidatus Eisenbacteria bacterium]
MGDSRGHSIGELPVELRELLDRNRPEPWSHGGKIPWHEPGFSARMLPEHLSQEHDLASRRSSKIDDQVEWLDREVLPEHARVLDLGCGPGLYSSRLAERGHSCVGIDFSPSSIEYARSDASSRALDCTYILGDLLSTDFGSGFDAVLLLYGEFNTFRRHEAEELLRRIMESLKPGGHVVLEVSTEELVRGLGAGAQSWYVSESGLFADEPHLCLIDCDWDETARASAERFTVFRSSCSAPDTYVCTTRAYTDSEYDDLLKLPGFVSIQRLDPEAETQSDAGQGLLMITAEAPAP